MEESKEGWARVHATLQASGEVLTPARRRAIEHYARQAGLWRVCQDEEALTNQLRDAISAIGATVEWSYAHRGIKPPRQGTYSPPEPQVTGTERLHARQVAASLVELDAVKLGAAEFRKEFLGGRKLGDESARLFVSSFAVQILSSERIHSDQIRLAGHRAEKLNKWDEHYFLPMKDGQLLLVLRLAVRIWGRGRQSGSRDFSLDVPTWPGNELPWKEALWSRRGQQPETIEYLPDSLFSRLWRLADHIAWSTWWSQADAAWFILTGVPPGPPTIQISMNRRLGQQANLGRIEMVIPQWISHETVRKAYKRGQDFMIGARPRALKKTSLERYGFVVERFGLAPSRRELNEGANEWARRRGLKGRGRATALQNFARDFERTKDAVLKPRLGMGRRKAEVDEEHALHMQVMRASTLAEKRSLIDALRVLRQPSGSRRFAGVPKKRRGKAKAQSR